MTNVVKVALIGVVGAVIAAFIPILFHPDFTGSERKFWVENLPPILEEPNLVKRIDRITVLASLSKKRPPAIDDLIKRWQDELHDQKAAEAAERETIEREREAKSEQDAKKKQEALAKVEAAKAKELKAKSAALKKTAASTKSVTSLLKKLKL